MFILYFLDKIKITITKEHGNQWLRSSLSPIIFLDNYKIIYRYMM